MNKMEYMKQLAYRFRKLPKEDYDRAMEYFSEYFEEAGAANEQIAIRDLGSPEEAANQIIQDIAYEAIDNSRQDKPERKKSSVVWLTILAVFASPIALPLALALLVIIIAILFVALTLVVSVAFTAVTIIGTSFLGIIGGIITCFQVPANGIATIGLSLCLLGIGMIIAIGAIKLAQSFGRKVPKIMGKFIKRKGAANHEKN